MLALLARLLLLQLNFCSRLRAIRPWGKLVWSACVMRPAAFLSQEPVHAFAHSVFREPGLEGCFALQRVGTIRIPGNQSSCGCTRPWLTASSRDYLSYP